jgi:hypothetical protein
VLFDLSFRDRPRARELLGAKVAQTAAFKSTTLTRPMKWMP